MRFGGKPRPPAWLAMLHGFLAAAAVTLMLYASATVGLSVVANGALALFLIAAAGGAYMNLEFHWKSLPLPKWLVLVHGATAVAGYLLLLAAALRAGPRRVPELFRRQFCAPTVSTRSMSLSHKYTFHGGALGSSKRTIALMLSSETPLLMSWVAGRSVTVPVNTSPLRIVMRTRAWLGSCITRSSMRATSPDSPRGLFLDAFMTGIGHRRARTGAESDAVECHRRGTAVAAGQWGKAADRRPP
jgi:hypothetical protein